MRPLVFAAVSATSMALLGGCTDATGSVQGGEALTSSGNDDGGCGASWSCLYTELFGPSGKAACSAQSSCHGDPSQSGAQTSGFVCGSTKDACWQGMTVGIPPAEGGIFPPILPPDAGDVTQTQLWLGLHKSQGGGLNNMPCGSPPPAVCQPSTATYTFTSDELARISTWAQKGAPND
jgi:hypothetical protein